MEKRYKAIWGKGEYDYFYYTAEELGDYEKEKGYLSELSCFRWVFNDMVLSNEILKLLCETGKYVEELVSGYDEKNDYYIDEYQFFIVDSKYDEESLIKIVKLMGNTLYYSEDLNNYIMGVTDLGTSRDYVLTDIKLEECE